MILTRLQRAALKRIYLRLDTQMTYLQFRRTVKQGHDCIMVPYCNMWLGVELDGYTHS